MDSILDKRKKKSSFNKQCHNSEILEIRKCSLMGEDNARPRPDVTGSMLKGFSCDAAVLR